MSPSDKKSKRKGVFGTILFHTVLIIMFFLIGLSYQDPPPTEEGISINFGNSNDGLGELESENIDNTIADMQNNNETLSEKIIKQNDINSIKLEKEKTNNKKSKKQTDKIIVEEKEKINKKALYNNKNQNQQSEGNNKKIKNKGIIDGNPNAVKYEGGGAGENGASYQLGNRKARVKPKPEGNQIEATVVVAITVDRLGNVTTAYPGIQGSTTRNKQLLQRAKNSALNTKFEAKESAPINQQGKIIYKFYLR